MCPSKTCRSPSMSTSNKQIDKLAIARPYRPAVFTGFSINIDLTIAELILQYAAETPSPVDMWTLLSSREPLPTAPSSTYRLSRTASDTCKANYRTLFNQFFLECSNYSFTIPVNPLILHSSTVLTPLHTTRQSLSTSTHSHPNNHTSSPQRQHKRPRTIPPAPHIPETFPKTCPASTFPAYLPLVLFRRHDVFEGLSSRGCVAYTFDDTM